MARSILAPRILLGTLVLTALLFPSLYDPLISSIYNSLYNSPLYRFSGFETLQTVFCYAVIEILYTVKFIENPRLRLDIRAKSEVDPKHNDGIPKRPRMRRPSRRKLEILTYIAPLLALDFTLIKKYAGVPVAAIRETGGYEPLVMDINEIISPSFLLPTVHNFSLSSPLQLWRALPEEAPSSRRLVLELALSFFIYDTLFFLTHLAFHRTPILARFHQPHHRHREMNPQVTNKLSIAERLSLVLLANFSLNIIKCHVLTRSAFVPIFVYLLVEIHSGLDLEWGYDKLLPFGLGAGAKKHAKHHREGKGEYEPFFGWWDRGLEPLEDRLRGR